MPPQTHPKIIFIVVCSIAGLAFLTAGSLCFCLLSKEKPDQVLLTAVVGLSTGCVGALTGLLINTRTTPPNAASTTETVSTTVTKQPPEAKVDDAIKPAQVKDEPINQVPAIS